ncbi:MAG: hypothetical protein [Wendovervirus sonii]|uniref:Uncharacterized protein n=1 Tax=phage Lak_Megaphage_Sonny TaxID=3109229 RepID=A0ABZ0Z3I9_9CAUD|nr:MAG: hypothetical protein [phage Lak_Megaphage_Sonny]
MKEIVEKAVNEYYSNDVEIALMVTIPKKIKWEDYLKEINAVKDGTQEMNFKVSSKPTKVSVGDKCFLCHDGYVKGWMRISSISKKAFQCTTTGKQWDEAWYVGRSGEFHPIEGFQQKGFMGYKYVNANDYL